MWKNTVELGRLQMTIKRIPISCWIPKVANTHSGCAIFIYLPLQKWLHERASMMSYTYIDCLLFSYVNNYSFDFRATIWSYLFYYITYRDYVRDSTNIS
jgi:hypothetical protein